MLVFKIVENKKYVCLTSQKKVFRNKIAFFLERSSFRSVHFLGPDFRKMTSVGEQNFGLLIQACSRN